MSQLAMQTLAMGCQSSLEHGVLSPGCFVPLALVPAQAGVSVLFDTTQLIIVFGIVCASLPLHLALQAPFFAGIGGQFLTEGHELGFAFAWHHGKRLGANIQTDDIGTTFLVLGLGECMALYNQLHEVAVSIVIGPLSGW